MPSEPTVLVLGPANLLATAMVEALRARDLAVEQARRLDGARFPGPAAHRRAVLVVGLDERGALRTIADAVGAGWTVLAHGGDATPERVAAAVAAGADGWLPGTSSFEVLAETLDAALAGRPVMPPEQHAEWVRLHQAHRARGLQRRERLDRLSPREREVLHHLAAGRRPADISQELLMPVTTVRSHIRAIFAKLGVHSQAQAAGLYRQLVQCPTRRPT